AGGTCDPVFLHLVVRLSCCSLVGHVPKSVGQGFIGSAGQFLPHASNPTPSSPFPPPFPRTSRPPLVTGIIPALINVLCEDLEGPQTPLIGQVLPNTTTALHGEQAQLPVTCLAEKVFQHLQRISAGQPFGFGHGVAPQSR